MGQPYVGEIRMFAGSFAPAEWMFCEGQLLSISEYEMLYYLIGTTYGGDGRTTFALPDLRGRIPVHQGNNAGNTYVLGQKAGVEQVTLVSSQMPAHGHDAAVWTEQGTTNMPDGAIWANSTLDQFGGGSPAGTMHPQALGLSGNNMPHDNLMPYLCVNFIISLYGIYPSQG
ncbi:tail fiber protein [Paenibacillus doosanensis]|uniref:Phage Tail Collar Domain protein n=1 Tax=Paenibacillus konkukensis TaxID=2020716 RepID=A0ABY4RPZ8_9BACL|nr:MULTISPECIES: tail fiber protein [Paenibacillus]MCS7459126.1 tail fiber protein [Paenibacillus doosanensis]UQZ84183.1 Phage Tail Collar Domain protein [Paenibacillus konkukensis]